MAARQRQRETERHAPARPHSRSEDTPASPLVLTSARHHNVRPARQHAQHAQRTSLLVVDADAARASGHEPVFLPLPPRLPLAASLPHVARYSMSVTSLPRGVVLISAPAALSPHPPRAAIFNAGELSTPALAATMPRLAAPAESPLLSSPGAGIAPPPRPSPALAPARDVWTCRS